MAFITGIDGCKAGWLILHKDLETGAIASEVFSMFKQLVSKWPNTKAIAIDIPIGLTESGPRKCDLLARKLLGQPRGSSVFPSPIRPAVRAKDREEADAITRKIDGKGVGSQAFGIYSRIREIDEIMRSNPELCAVTFEVHPELCFKAWNKGQPIISSKKAHEGMTLRSKLAESHYGAEVVRAIRLQHPPSKVADDDIYDAFAALWTAERIVNGEAEEIPDDPETDSYGLPMRMLF